MINPVNIDVINWSDQTSLLLSRYGIVRRLDDPLHWKEWAREANDVPAVRKLLPPDPSPFTAWQDWADRFNQAVSQLGV